MNPKKQFSRILSILLSVLFLSSLAFTAFAEYEEYDKDDPSQWVEHNGTLIPKEVYDRDYASAPSAPEVEPEPSVPDASSKLHFAASEPEVEPKLPPLWGGGLTDYLDDAMTTLHETKADGVMPIRADKSGMVSISRSILQAFEDRGDFDLECFYDRFGTTMKLVIPAGTKVIEQIGDASFVEFNTLADLLGLTPIPESEADKDPEAESIVLERDPGEDMYTSLWYHLDTPFHQDTTYSIRWRPREDGLSKLDLLKDGGEQPLTPDENGELEIPVEPGKAEALVNDGFAMEGKTPEETKDDISSLLALLQGGMDEKKSDYLQPDQDISFVLVFEEEQEKTAYEAEKEEPTIPEIVAAADSAKAVLLYDEQTADLQQLLRLDRQFFADEAKIQLSENAAEILENDPSLANAVMEAILTIDRHRNHADDSYSFDLGDGESVTFTKNGITGLLSKARERIIYKSEEEQNPAQEDPFAAFLAELLKQMNDPYYTPYVENNITITLVFQPEEDRVAFEEQGPEGPRPEDFTFYN